MTVTPEQILIGSLFKDPSNWFNVRKLVSEDDFQDIRCAILFKGIERLDCKYDIVLLDDWLKKNGHDGLIDFMRSTIQEGEPIYAVEYAGIVKENARLRKLSVIAENVRAKKPSQEIVKDMESGLMTLYADGDERGFRDSREISLDYATRLMEMQKRNVNISGLTTGFRRIDETTDGLKGGELIIIGSRPSIGKTALMVSMADHIAVILCKNVAVFSLESPEQELFHRFISQRARIVTKRLRQGNFTEHEQQNFNIAFDMFSKSGLYINDVGSQNLSGIRMQLRQLMNEGKKPDVVFIDYLQRMEVEKGYDNYALRLGKVTKGLKNIAKEMDIPVVALAQINRNNGEASPRLVDLKESGEIEADADIIMLLQREEFYKKDLCQSEKKGKIDIDIAKNRNGPVELIELNFDKQFTRIYESEQITLDYGLG